MVIIINATFSIIRWTAVPEANVDFIETVKMACTTPARIMGFKTKGSLDVGMDADITIFDEDINIKQTIVNGSIVYDINN